MPESRQNLYNTLSDTLDIGSWDEFNSKMESIDSRNSLYEQVSELYDIGTREEFEEKIIGYISPEYNESFNASQSDVSSLIKSPPLDVSDKSPVSIKTPGEEDRHFVVLKLVSDDVNDGYENVGGKHYDELAYSSTEGESMGSPKLKKRRELEADGYRIFDINKNQLLPTYMDSINIENPDLQYIGPRERGAWDAVSDIAKDPVKYTPYIRHAKEWYELGNILEIGLKIQNGEGVTEEELSEIYSFLDEREEEKYLDNTWGATVVDIVAQMPAFFGEMWGAGKLVSAGTSVARKQMKSVLSKEFKDQLGDIIKSKGGSLASKTAKVATKTAVGAETSGLRKVSQQRRRTSGIELDENEDFIFNEIFKNKSKARKQAIVDSYTEFFVEQLGATGVIKKLTGVPKKGASFILDKTVPDNVKSDIMEKAFVKAIMNANKGASKSDVVKMLNHMKKVGGYDGVLEEFLEERIGEGIRHGVFELDKYGIVDGLDDPSFEWQGIDMEQYLAEIVAFSVFGAPKSVASAKRYYDYSKLDDVHEELSKARDSGLWDSEVIDNTEALIMQNPKAFRDKSVIEFVHERRDMTRSYLKDVEGMSDSEIDELYVREGLDVRLGEEASDINRPLRALGSTKVIETEEGINKVLIRLYEGASVDTVVEEFYGNAYKLLSEADKATILEYKEKVGDTRSTQEFFEQNGIEHFWNEAPYSNTVAGRVYGKLKSFFKEKIIKNATLEDKIQRMWDEAGQSNLGSVENIHYADESYAMDRIISNEEARENVSRGDSFKNKKGEDILGNMEDIPEGTEVKVRLNINSQITDPNDPVGKEGKGLKLQTIHPKGLSNWSALSYETAVTLDNPTFYVNQTGREQIATGAKPKHPAMSVNGELSKSPHKLDGVRIIFNPMADHLFKVAETGRPVKSVDGEVTVHQSDVWARGNIEYYTEENMPQPKGDVNTSVKVNSSEEASTNKVDILKKGRVIDRIMEGLAGDGFTWHPHLGDMASYAEYQNSEKKNNKGRVVKTSWTPDGLWAVSLFPESSLIKKDISEKDVVQWIEKNSDIIESGNYSIGGWTDKETGKTYLDVVVTVKDKSLAESLGKKYNQKAIFDLVSFEEIDTGGDGKVKDFKIDPVDRYSEVSGSESFSVETVDENVEDSGVMFIGADAVSVDMDGNRHPSGYTYPDEMMEKGSGWQLSKGGATRLRKMANQGYKTVAIVVYPNLQKAMRQNPLYKKALERNIIKKHGKRKAVKFLKEGQAEYDALSDAKKKTTSPEQLSAKKAKVSLIGTAREISADDFNEMGGQIRAVGRFKETRTDEDRIVKHPSYPAEVVFENYQVLPKPVDFQNFVGKLSETDKRFTHKGVAWLMMQTHNFMTHKDNSPLIPKLIEAGKGDVSLLQKDIDKGRESFQVEPIWESKISKASKKLMGSQKSIKIQSIPNTLKKMGVSEEEMDWAQLGHLLSSSNEKISTEELHDFITELELEVEEKVLGRSDELKGIIGKLKQESENLQQELNEELRKYRSQQNEDKIESVLKRRDEIDKELDNILKGNIPEALHGKWTPYTHTEFDSPPAGYKELLITLPRERITSGEFVERAHFSTPNVVVFIRFDSRIKDGKRVMFVNEIQSDWHTEGQNDGYRTEPFKEVTEIPEGWEYNSETRKLYRLKAMGRVEAMLGQVSAENKILFRTNATKERALATINQVLKGIWERQVPNAPFKKNWLRLAQRRILKYAVDNGFDSVEWITGEESADMYDVRNHIDTIHYKKLPSGAYKVLWEKDGSFPMDDTTLTEDKLESYFSKSIAKQIIDGEGHKSSIGGGNKALDAKDMKVGGTFHKTFYNKKVPSGFKKLIKRFGGSVSHDKFRHSIDITPDIAKGFSGPQETFSIVEYVDKVPEKVKREVIKPYERRPAKFYRKAFVPISTRLGRIHPRLKFALRKFEKSFLQQNESDLGEVEGFLNAVRKLSDVDRFNLDMALFNGDFSKVNEIAIKNGFKKDVTKLQIVLDGIYQRALENGMDVSFIENYYPRRVKDLEALKESMGTEQLGAIEKAWADYAKKKGVHVSDLDAVVKTGLVNQVINRNISTLKTNPDNSKARSIAVVTPDMMENYSDSLTSLIDYIETMNESMAMKKLLGQDDPLEIKEMFPGAETERLDAITRYVAGMVEQYKLTPQQQEELTGALRARFTRVGTGLGTQVVKDITYMMTLGSPTTTVTQLGDLFFSLGQAGIIPTSKAILNVLSGKAKTNRKKLGLNTIAQEFKDTRSTARALNRIFKLTGFSAMDGFFKDVIIDAELNRMKSVLTSKGENRFTKRKTELENHLKDIFGGEYESVRADIINGEMSENVEMLLFSTLSDYHPVTLSEMPETYLKTSGGRIFYQLKTFTMKQLDTFRTRAYDKMKSGDPDDRVRGLANLLRLGVWFIISGWTADNIKDWMMNREIHLDDTVYDQMFKLIGSSRYIAYQARRHGPEQAIVKQFAPPQLGLAHDFWRDVKDLIKEEDPRDFHEIRAVAKIPVIGKLFYGWYGGGSGEFKTERELSRWTRVSKDRALNRKEQNKYFDVMMNAYSNGEISKRTFDNHYDKMIGLSLEEND